jgi:hypothetical protein
VCTDPCLKAEGEVGWRHLDQWPALDVVDPDQVDRDVEASSSVDHHLGVLLDSLLRIGVHHGRLGRSAGGPNFRRHHRERRPPAAGQEHRRTLPGERPGHRATQRTSGSVDHRVSTLQQHSGLPPSYKGPPGQTRTAGKTHRSGQSSLMARGRPARLAK